MSCEEGFRDDEDDGGEIVRSRRRMLSRTNMSRFILATVLIIPLAVLVTVRAKFYRSPPKLPRETVGRRALLGAVREWSLKGLSRQAVEKEQPLSTVDTDMVNVTVILEHFELGPQAGEGSSWMFSMGTDPFVESNQTDQAYFANSNFTWNSEGRGDTSCRSGGSGKPSRGYIDPFHNFLNLSTATEYTHTVASLTNLHISEFKHINTVDSNAKWDTMGQAGDSRRYKDGVLEIREDTKTLVKATEVQWIQDLSYPAPAGASKPGVFELSAYFVAKIDLMSSDIEWVKQLDPQGLGYMLGIVTGGSFGAPTCYTSNSYWVTLRGFPKLTVSSDASSISALSPSKIGPYPGSSPSCVGTAKALAGLASQAVTAVTVAAIGASVGSASIAAVGGQAPTPPSGGVVTLMKAAAFTAKLSQIPGFHTDAMKAFGSGLDPFLVRFHLPFVSPPKVNGGTISAADRIGVVIRQGSDVDSGPPPPSTISNDLFKGNAFWCTIIIMVFAVVQLCIWLATKNKPIEVRVGSQAWMIYLFSLGMSYLYTGSVLASMQYFRSNIPYGTGKAGIYFVAGCQLLLIGIGFLAFFSAIMVLALRQLRCDKVRWVPKQLLSDPDLRRSANIAGEYEAGHRVWFHKLFQCYYNQMSGPRVWLAVMELSIIFIDALVTALVWNQVVCISILIFIYAVMLILFVALTPHRDRIQGVLVILLVLSELMAFVLELVGSLADYATAEKCETGATIFGFIAIMFAVVIAIYCDLIPTGKFFYRKLRERYFPGKPECLDERGDEKSEGSTKSHSSSEWSGLYSSDDQSDAGGETNSEYPQDSEALVAYNADRESRANETLATILGRKLGKKKKRKNVERSNSSESDKHDNAF